MVSAAEPHHPQNEPMIEGLHRTDIERLTVRVLRPPVDARPDVRLIELDGKRLVVKDYATGGTRFKSALGVYLVAREDHALARANGLPGIPRYYGLIDPYALVTEYIEAEAAPEVPREWLDEDLFTALEKIVTSFHARGVVHCDLKKLDNILVTRDRKPFVIDFTAAFVSGSNPFSGLLFDHMRDDDFRGIYKLKRRFAPHLLTPEEETFLDFRSVPERGFRSFREHIRNTVQRWSAAKT